MTAVVGGLAGGMVAQGGGGFQLGGRGRRDSGIAE